MGNNVKEIPKIPEQENDSLKGRPGDRKTREWGKNRFLIWPKDRDIGLHMKDN